MKSRRSIFCVAVFVLAGCGVVFGQSGGAQFSITLNTTTASIRQGGELRAQVTLKNITNRGIGITIPRFDDRAEDSYEIEVLDEKGKPPPDTAFSRARKERGRIQAGSDIIDTLKPGDELKDAAVITKLYDLTMAGKYVVQFSRRVEAEQGGGKVKSNAITITVAP
jgi:hypothetical protein